LTTTPAVYDRVLEGLAEPLVFAPSGRPASAASGAVATTATGVPAEKCLFRP
jgi:hypothetical protein